jgi:hypothetical protein
MIANGVPVTFDFVLIIAIFGIVIGGGYAVLWGLRQLKSLFTGK